MTPLRHTGRLLVAVACALLVVAPRLRAQSNFEKTLDQFNQNDVKGYIQPFGDLFGTDMNAGMFHSAEIARTGFHMSFEIVGMASMVGDAQKTYTLNSPVGSFKTATIFGGGRDSLINPKTGQPYYGIAGGFINTPALPLAAPQITIGDVFGTRAIIRYIGIPALSGLPSASLFGIGAQHSVNQWLPVIPLDVAAHIYYSKFSFGDLINFSGLAIGAQASKSFSVLRVYGGLQWEKSSMEVKYTPADVTVPAVDITMDGANSFRATLGLCLHLGFFSIFGDANFGSITNYSAGIGFGG
ncbi:MAG TPA: DUF6588 family protein [Bacteroidota bacterium]|nr:DUF6588 family protein [Bacteroidota bacterium]